MKIVVIIPTYNEKSNIEKMIPILENDIFPEIGGHKISLLIVNIDSLYILILFQQPIVHIQPSLKVYDEPKQSSVRMKCQTFQAYQQQQTLLSDQTDFP